ncbi:MAG TPA: ubiquinone/menaquinone biosynthesis methyltransferase, partial [Candidatus Acidoferrales bacterium]|nr:ubiquinone/menaquinone biosynthesis methyltransferase [Candidatus Acidoferrales bacterium]
PQRPGNAAPTPAVAAMFDRLASRYDAMNALISGFQEPRWRRRLVGAAALGPGMAAVDVATGTGKVASDLADRVGPFGRVVGIDVSGEMIALAQARTTDRVELEFVVGDAMALPLGDGAFDAATIAFGMRNLPDYGRGFAEMRRVVRPGGIVACLEIARPRSIVGRLGRVWFERAVPLLGRLVRQGPAYRYLVDSVRAYPPPEEIATVMRAAGLADVRWQPMLFGMVTLHTGRVPRDD